MRFARTALCLLVSMSCSAQLVSGGLCEPDVTPAATLLVPYFAVDVSDAACTAMNGLTTTLTLTNATASPTVTHLTFWSDLSVPVMDFDIFMTGFDVQTLDLTDVFCGGILPQTGSGVSPQGPLSQDPAPGLFSNCEDSTTLGTGNPPNYSNPAINRHFRDHLKAWLTGQASPVLHGNQCAGSDRGDEIAVGYITVDAIEDCSTDFPSESGYFGPGGVASTTNRLLGEYTHLNPATGFAARFHAVHIEADASLFNTQPTFYGRYTSDESNSDEREPLSSTWAFRFSDEDGMTQMIAWREGEENSSFTCGLPPTTLPGVGAVFFDEAENPATSELVFPNETASQIVAPAAFNPFSSGWAVLRLDHQLPGTVAAGSRGQAWVGTIVDALSGTASLALPGTPLDDPCTGLVVVDPRQPIFGDGFESGDVDRWSASVP